MAENAVKLMIPQVKRKLAVEQEKKGACSRRVLTHQTHARACLSTRASTSPVFNTSCSCVLVFSGLIIVNAWYGNLAKFGVDEPSPYVIDVTIPLQYLVEDSQLHLHNTSKSKLMGFYDPCIGEDKALHIRYLFR